MAGIVINLPYTAQAAPPAVARHLGLSPEEWQLEHWRLTDPHLADIVREAAASEKGELPVLSYPYSPLVADPWGFWKAELVGEASEPARPGIPSQTSAGKPIQWSPKDAETIMGRTVSPFHEAVAAAAQNILEDSPGVLMLTLRSFNSRPWRFEKNQKFPRPQAAVGSEPGLTPEGLANLAGSVFRSFGWWAELDWPQGGAAAPEIFKNAPRVKALGISVCRGLYMDEKSGRRKAASSSVIRILRTLFNLLDQELERVVKIRRERMKPKANPNIIKARKSE